MKRHARLSVAGSLAATVRPGTLVLTAPAALAEPRPQRNTADSPLSSGTKAYLEYLDRQAKGYPQTTRAQIEYEERLAEPPASTTGADDSVPASEGFPWVIAGLSTLGVTAVIALIAGGVAASRRSRQEPKPAGTADEQDRKITSPAGPH